MQVYLNFYKGLTHYCPAFALNTLWKHKNSLLSDVFRGHYQAVLKFMIKFNFHPFIFVPQNTCSEIIREILKKRPAMEVF